MYLLVVFSPLITCLLSLLFGRFIGKKGVIVLLLVGLFCSFFGSFYLYYEICLVKTVCVVSLFKWIDLVFFSVDISFYYDVIVCIMLFVVSFISLLVHIYSIEYMSYDPSFNRFFSYLSIFTFFMFLLVTADGLIQLFFGWEGVGLASYLLINFWYTRILANKAAIKAMLVNRIGDLSLLLAISICILYFSTVKYAVIFSVCVYFSDFFIFIFGFKLKLLFIICFFLFLGAMGKSAQLGLHMWLPDAMEGPTPVSALIHAATMLLLVFF